MKLHYRKTLQFNYENHNTHKTQNTNTQVNLAQITLSIILHFNVP